MLVAAGTLDPSFSGDGKTTLPSLNETLVATDVAVQSDGKTVVVGRSQTPGVTQFAVARFNLDGSLDTSFGGGLVRSLIGDENTSSANAVAITPDQKIVVVGNARVNDVVTESEMAIAVFNPNGSLDTTFSGDGKQTFDLGDFGDNTNRGHDVAVQLDGRIVVVGETFRGLDIDFFVIRMHPDGALDNSFDGDGKRTLALGGNDIAAAVKVRVDGSIYIAGEVDTGGLRRTHLIRLAADGDTTVAQAAFALPGRSETLVQDLVLAADGKVVITGHSVGLDGLNDFFIARFNADIVLDTTFGEGGSGFRVTDFGGDDTVGGMVISPSGGGFIVSGRSLSTMTAVKYTDNGALDTTFGSGGIVRVSGFGGTANIARGPGRRVVLAGGSGFQTARLLTAGANLVTVAPFDSIATEGKVDPALFVVRRNELLPTATRVFFSIGGTALGRTPALPGTLDYTLDKLVQPIATFGQPTGTPFVDIPAGEQFAFVTLTTLNDTRVEGTETAIFTVLANANYEVGAPQSVTITIIDDDRLTFTVGTTTATAPPKQVEVGQEVQSAVTWTVPTGGWRQLSTIEVRLRDLDEDDALVLLTFDEATNSFALDATAAASYGPVSLVLDKCTFAAAGPDAPTVTVTFTFRFAAAAARRRFALEVAATNDEGTLSGFEQIGKLHVREILPAPVPSLGPGEEDREWEWG
jgi:uncharacterized delta-60 repeat protein